MDKIFDKIAAIGIPGLVLVVVMATSGYAGAAAITTALAVLGGPIGMIGGIGILIILGLISKALTQKGIEITFRQVLKRIKKQGNTNEEIRRIIGSYWFLTKDMKKKLEKYIDMWGND